MPETRQAVLLAGVETVMAVVPNAEAAVDSLVDLGFSEVWRNGGSDEHVTAAVSLGNADLELMAPRDPEGPSFLAQSLRAGGGLSLISFATPDLEETIAALREKGAQVPDPTFRKGATRDFKYVLVGPNVTPGIRGMITQYMAPSPRKGSTHMKINKLDHVVIATKDLDNALELWERNVGLKPDTSLDRPLGSGFKAARLPIGDSFLELVQPVEESGRFYEQVQERGEGLFSISVEVEDLDEAVTHLRGKGAKVSDPEPSIWPGARLARISGSSAHGVSIQLIERK